MGTDTSVAVIGMDIHRTFSKVTARDAAQKILWRQRLEHRQRQTLRQSLSRWPGHTPVVLEGSFGWSWLADELCRADLQPHLASSRKVALWRDLHGLAKSDRTDADLLSLMGFEPPRLWEVWLPPPEVRQQREWLRYRMSLVQTQTAFKNRVHAILHRHGIFPDVQRLFGTTGRRWLQQLQQHPDLPDSGRAVLRGYLQLLDHLRLLIAQATRAFRRQVTQHPPASRLKTIPGIKWILAYTLLAEIGNIERFRSARHLVSYSLLAPRAHDSGSESDQPPHGRHVGRAGRRTLKWAYIEAAHSAVRKSPGLRAWFNQYTQNGSVNVNRGYIGVARRLCQYSYAIWKQEVNYQEPPPVRPGNHRRRRTTRRRQRAIRADHQLSCEGPEQATRPVKGQPLDALAPVAVR